MTLATAQYLGAVPAPARDATEITGTVSRVREFGDDGFVVVDLQGGPRITGELDAAGELTPGVAYRFFGQTADHPRYGQQFRFHGFAAAAQQSQAGTVAFLVRGGAGLRASQANRIWKKYGPDAIARLRDNPAYVATDCLIDMRVAEEASRKLQLDAEFAATKIELFELFAGRGIPRAAVNACLRRWGHDAPAIIRRDPFKMLVAGIPGVGFARADKMYLDLGGNPVRLKRSMLAAWHAMQTGSSGNTWELEGVMWKAMLIATGQYDELHFTRALRLGIRAGWIVMKFDGCATWYADRARANAEDRLAFHINRLLGGRPAWPELGSDSGLSPHQLDRYRACRSSPVAVLAGTPGTGKTYTAAAVLKQLRRETHRPIAVCAPTGKAAVRIAEAMSRYQLDLGATTIHSLLGVKDFGNDGWVFAHDETTPLNVGTVVLDEASMLDTTLAAHLFAAIPTGANVLLVGDPYQLPPVDHGAPLRDLMECGRVPVGMLSEIKRNSGRIVQACAAIKDGARPEFASGIDIEAGENLVHVATEDAEHQVGYVMSLLNSLREKGFDPVWDVQILTATNESGPTSRKPLNERLQAWLNKPVEGLPEGRTNARFRVGDKVICLKNQAMGKAELREPMRDGEEVDPADIASYSKGDGTYIANGDLGRVEAVSPKEIVVKFTMPDRTVRLNTAKKGDGGATVDLAYAITIHKSQGSEWPVAIVIVDERAGPIGCRELVYTAVSRAGKLGFVIGKQTTLMRHVRKVTLGKRKTMLVELLRRAGDEK